MRVPYGEGPPGPRTAWPDPRRENPNLPARKSDEDRERESRERLGKPLRYQPPPRSSGKVDGRFASAEVDRVYPKRVIGPSGIQRRVQGPPVAAPARGLPARDGTANRVAGYGGASLAVPQSWGQGYDAGYLRDHFAQRVAVRSRIVEGRGVVGGGYEIRLPTMAEARDRAMANFAEAMRLIGQAIRDPENARLRYNAVAPGAKNGRAMPSPRAVGQSTRKADPFVKAIDPGRSVRGAVAVSDIELARFRRKAEKDHPILCDTSSAEIRAAAMGRAMRFF